MFTDCKRMFEQNTIVIYSNYDYFWCWQLFNSTYTHSLWWRMKVVAWLQIIITLLWKYSESCRMYYSTVFPRLQRVYYSPEISSRNPYYTPTVYTIKEIHSINTLPSSALWSTHSSTHMNPSDTFCTFSRVRRYASKPCRYPTLTRTPHSHSWHTHTKGDVLFHSQ